jgi:hypothetical protein
MQMVMVVGRRDRRQACQRRAGLLAGERRIRDLEALLELVDRQSSLRGVLAQGGCDPIAIGVADPQRRLIGRSLAFVAAPHARHSLAISGRHPRAATVSAGVRAG